MDGLFVVGHQLVLVLALQLLFAEVEVQCDLLVALELHDDEGIPRLALPQRGVEADAEHKMKLVGLGKYHELLDGLVLDLVVVRLAPETERGVVHADVEPSSARRVSTKPSGRRGRSSRMCARTSG